MVKSVTSFGRNGLSDWITQRITGIVLLAYILFLGCQILSNDFTYVGWVELFSATWVRVFSMAALISLAIHAWIGLWCISTDYITTHTLSFKLGPAIAGKANVLRWAFQAACAILLFTYVIWGIQILWG